MPDAAIVQYDQLINHNSLLWRLATTNAGTATACPMCHAVVTYLYQRYGGAVNSYRRHNVSAAMHQTKDNAG